ncbi:hypothetical protein LXA43DRAFT_941906 [Ganoderma leucocontextum]|nr:hypothetical protein LXA43DRAFT_941906 [Ganoderma leucocontextum]
MAAPTNSDASSLALAQTLSSTLVDDQIIIILSSVFFGVLTMLIVASTYILFLQGLRRLAVRLLLACTIALYASSIVYWATLLEFSINTSKLLVSAVNQIGTSSSSEAGFSMGLSEAARACLLTAAFTVNVCIGDAVVWWRARMLYPGNKKIRHVCCALLSSTFVLGIVSTRRSVFVENKPGTIPMVYSRDPFGTAAIALSLATNVFSTALIGYKTWEHRQFLRQHLGGVGSSTQVLKVMALLVESGMIYCLVWVEFLVYHVVADMKPDSNGGRWRAASFYHEACVAPIVAIYPMVIVVLVALNQSQLEHGLTRSQQLDRRSLSTWAVASRSYAHTASTRVWTRASGLGGCPISSAGTRVGDEETVHQEGIVETRSSMESDPLARQMKGDQDADDKASAVETIKLPTLSHGK